MSIAMMTWVWQTSDLKGTELLIELALADFANDEGKCWPSVRTIARKARCSERRVQLALNRLKDEGRLSVDEQASETHRHTNVYTLVGAEMGEKSAPLLRNKGRTRGEKNSPRGVISSDEKSQQMGDLLGPKISPDPSGSSTQSPEPPVESPAMDRALRHRLILGTELLPGEMAQVEIEFPGQDLNKAWREWRIWIEEEPERRIPRDRLKAFRGFVKRQVVDREAGSKATGPPRRQAAGVGR